MENINSREDLIRLIEIYQLNVPINEINTQEDIVKFAPLIEMELNTDMDSKLITIAEYLRKYESGDSNSIENRVNTLEKINCNLIDYFDNIKGIADDLLKERQCDVPKTITYKYGKDMLYKRGTNMIVMGTSVLKDPESENGWNGYAHTDAFLATNTNGKFTFKILGEYHNSFLKVGLSEKDTDNKFLVTLMFSRTKLHIMRGDDFITKDVPFMPDDTYSINKEVRPDGIKINIFRNQTYISTLHFNEDYDLIFDNSVFSYNSGFKDVELTIF